MAKNCDPVMQSSHQHIKCTFDGDEILLMADSTGLDALRDGCRQIANRLQTVESVDLPLVMMDLYHDSSMKLRFQATRTPKLSVARRLLSIFGFRPIEYFLDFAVSRDGEILVRGTQKAFDLLGWNISKLAKKPIGTKHMHLNDYELVTKSSPLVTLVGYFK